MEVGLRSTGKPVGKPPIPAATAPRLYSTNNYSARVRLFIPPLCHDDCGQATPEAGKPARQMAGKPSRKMAGKRSGKYKMKGFYGG